MSKSHIVIACGTELTVEVGGKYYEGYIEEMRKAPDTPPDLSDPCNEIPGVIGDIFIKIVITGESP